jgi:hypothetical protein
MHRNESLLCSGSLHMGLCRGWPHVAAVAGDCRGSHSCAQSGGGEGRSGRAVRASLDAGGAIISQVSWMGLRPEIKPLRQT